MTLGRFARIAGVFFLFAYFLATESPRLLVWVP